jgi:hypothetical protein
MATVRIEFETDNAAFGETSDDALEEMQRICARACEAIADRCTTARLRDSNGNTVGKVTVSE